MRAGGASEDGGWSHLIIGTYRKEILVRMYKRNAQEIDACAVGYVYRI